MTEAAALIQGYIDDVLDEKILVCRAVRAAVERHLNDLKRQGTDDFPYYYDDKYAAKVVSFYPSVLRHSIGRHAGQPFHLSPWQAFCEGQIFGWKRVDDDTRRYRKAYESVARKNGKSTRAAGRAIFMARFDNNPVAAKLLGRDFVPEPVSQVVLCATKIDQAQKAILAECMRMRKQSPAIFKGSKDKNKMIRFDQNDGEIIAVGSDRPFDGLNIHSIFMDELHAWKEQHRPFYDTITTGSGTRSQPLTSILTTAGNDKSLIWREVYDYAKAVVLGNHLDDRFFSYIAELDEDDDPFDEANWIKANPNLGVSVSLDFLRGEADQMRTTVVGVSRFTRYFGNRPVASTEKAFDPSEWAACEGELSDWSESDAITAGVDLGSRDDFAAYALVARFPLDEVSESGQTIYRYEVKTKAYISEDTTRDLNKEPFATFIYTGELIRCKYPIQQLQEDLFADCYEHNVRFIGYDPANANATGEQMHREGYIGVRIGQNCTMFNEPIREFLQCVKTERVRHNGSPLLAWCLNNATIRNDSNNRWMFDKEASSEKIDPVVAMHMAFRICSIQPAASTGSLIEF